MTYTGTHRLGTAEHWPSSTHVSFVVTWPFSSLLFGGLKHFLYTTYTHTVSTPEVIESVISVPL